MQKQAIFRPNPHLPDDVKRGLTGTSVTGSYKLCISQDGSIGSVAIVRSIPGADDAIIATLRTWRYQPQPEPICFFQFLEFVMEEAAPAATAVRPLIKPAPAVLRREKIFAPDPHLPDALKAAHPCSYVVGSYSLCVAPDGRIDAIEPLNSIPEADGAIMQTLRQWRFNPIPSRQCFTQHLEFHIEGSGGCPAGIPALSFPLLSVEEALAEKTSQSDMPTLPDAMRAALLCSKLSAVYRVTIGNTGRAWAKRTFGSSAAEDAIIRTIERWSFERRPQPALFDYAVRLRILCDGTEERLGASGEVLSRSAPLRRLVTADVMRAEKLAGDEPQLPSEARSLLRQGPLRPSYLVCIGRDGAPDSIEPIAPLAAGVAGPASALAGVEQQLMAALARWRFKPQTEPTCFAQELRFAASESR
ncbi:MAG: hypothetical protein U1A78_25670 [Polyangia bacterium]